VRDPSEQIVIDHDVLLRSAATLRRATAELAAASAAISAAPLSGGAFGLMNSWMVAPVHAVSSNSAEHLRVSSGVVEVVASATEAAADDFARNEDEVLRWVEKLDAELAAAQAPLAPPPPVAVAPQPVPSPSPQPAPTPPAEDGTP
jgi:hypothetical protein